MPAFQRRISLQVLTPDGPVTSAEATGVVFPGADGQIGVLGGRSPLLSLVGAGRLAVTRVDGESEEFFVHGGFVRVAENAMTVLAEECSRVEDIDREEAWDRLTAADAMPSETIEQRERRDEVRRVARLRFNLAQEHWRRRHGGERRVFDRE